MTSDHATTAPAATHACVRCGAATALDRGLCEDCNPLGLKDAASSQVHGTVFVGVLAAVLILAVIARTAVSGVGPFPATITGVLPSGQGLEVTVTVRNDGTSAGQTTCRLSDPSRRGVGRTALMLSPRIDPGESVTLTRRVGDFGSTPLQLAVECSSP
jgi:hypothetical protein